jgi:hypothetical protein
MTKAGFPAVPACWNTQKLRIEDIYPAHKSIDSLKKKKKRERERESPVLRPGGEVHEENDEGKNRRKKRRPPGAIPQPGQNTTNNKHAKGRNCVTLSRA